MKKQSIYLLLALLFLMMTLFQAARFTHESQIRSNQHGVSK